MTKAAKEHVCSLRVSASVSDGEITDAANWLSQIGQQNSLYLGDRRWLVPLKRAEMHPVTEPHPQRLRSPARSTDSRTP